MHYEENIARSGAAYAPCCRFSVRRGFAEVDYPNILVIDNNPVDDLNRHEQLEALKAAVTATQDIEYVAEASYPIGGAADGYSIAMVFRTGDREGAEEVIAAEWDRVVLETEPRDH